VSVNYFKYVWEESRGDDYDNWGTSTWYFEVDEDMRVVRQIEIYSNGNVLHYDGKHTEDKYGFLSDQKVDEKFGNDLVKIEQTEFENMWLSPKPLNL